MPDKPVVLIVDDSEDNIELLTDVIEDECNVLAASSGRQCLHIARDAQPNLIILDVKMPDMNGFDVCEQLKADTDTTGIPIIFLTGMMTEADERQGLQLGAVDYITKPFSPAIVRARLKTHLAQQQLHQKLARMAKHDQLTGLYNRHHFLELVSHIRAHTLPKHYCIMLIDLDHFKRVNDSKGHLFGDFVLQSIADVLRNESRKHDITCRWGGEEFLVLLNESLVDDALAQANRIRGRIEQLSDEDHTITVSIGVCKWDPERSELETAISLADQALYEAKSAGRNCVKRCEQ